MKRDWKHIGFSVFLAVLLWAIVTMSGNFYTSVYLPVRVHLNDSTLAVSSVSNRFVIVGVQGKGWVLSGYYWGGDQFMDIYPEAKTGSQLITVRDIIKSEKIFSSETNIINVSPEVIAVTVEKRISKNVKVVPRLRLNFSEKYSLVEPPKVTPAKVVVSGPKTLVERIDSVFTEPVKLDELQDTLTFQAKLSLPKYVTSEKKYVQIFLNVQKIVDKQFRDVQVNIKGVPPKVELIIFPTKINVNLRGGINILGKLTDKDIYAYVLYGETIKDTTGALKPHLIIPSGVRLIGWTPEKIEYVIKK